MTAGPARRDVLRGAGAAGAVAVTLASCGSPGETAPPTGSVTIPASRIPVGGGVVDQGTQIVVTQPQAGEYQAFGARCPHQGCLVTEVADGKIVCPCHMSSFSARTGEVQGGPAKSGLRSVPVKVSGADVIAGG